MEILLIAFVCGLIVWILVKETDYLDKVESVDYYTRNISYDTEPSPYDDFFKKKSDEKDENSDEKDENED